MARRIREEIIEDDVVEVAPAPRRVTTERRVSGPGTGPGFGGNPAMLVMAAVLAVFIIVLVFGYLV